MEHPDNQRDSEKTGAPFESSQRETLKSGVFLVHRRRREIFSATQEVESGHFGLRMTETAQTKPILCVFAYPFYSSGDPAPAVHHQQASTCKQHVLALGLCG
jgi:hypothetical protein